MTWTARTSRAEILREVSAVADQRRDGRLPTDLDGVRGVFRDDLDLLGALQLRWATRLAGRIDRELMDQPLDLEAAVVTAWRNTAAELPGIRTILDHHRDHPADDHTARALAVATGKERAWLAVMAGQAGLADPGAAEVGAWIEEKARAGHRAPPRPARSHRDDSGRGLFDRLRALVAA